MDERLRADSSFEAALSLLPVDHGPGQSFALKNIQATTCLRHAPDVLEVVGLDVQVLQVVCMLPAVCGSRNISETEKQKSSIETESLTDTPTHTSKYGKLELRVKGWKATNMMGVQDTKGSWSLVTSILREPSLSAPSQHQPLPWMVAAVALNLVLSSSNEPKVLLMAFLREETAHPSAKPFCCCTQHNHLLKRARRQLGLGRASGSQVAPEAKHAHS